MLPLCAIDGHSTNPLYYYYKWVALPFLGGFRLVWCVGEGSGWFQTGVVCSRGFCVVSDWCGVLERVLGGFRLVWCVGEGSGWFQTGVVCCRGFWVVSDWCGVLERILGGFRLVWCVGEGSGWFQTGVVCCRGYLGGSRLFHIMTVSFLTHVDLFYQQGTGGLFHCVFIRWTDPWHGLFTTGQFEIDPKDLTLGEQLGAGCFGVSGRQQLSFLYQVLALLSGVKAGLCLCWLSAAQFFGTTECRISALRVFLRQR